MNVKIIIENFNVRVYGVLIEKNAVLITRENRFDIEMIKFPGGGLEKGEGIRACLEREFQEEFGVEIELVELFYINEFFQQSAFASKDQLISIYYKVRRLNETEKIVSKEEGVGVEWHNEKTLNKEMMTFPIDKIVAEMIGE